MQDASALISQLGQLVSPGPGFDTVNRLGEAASTESGELDITKNMFSFVRSSRSPNVCVKECSPFIFQADFLFFRA